VVTGYRLYIGYGIVVAGKELLCRQLDIASGNKVQIVYRVWYCGSWLGVAL
jgi:hypothetical protein